MSNRNLTVDIAKGLGIIFVVFGHNWIVKDQPGELFRIIFSFHIPLFFFMSGLFLKDSDSLKKNIIRRADTLLKPYWVVLSVIGLLKVFSPFPTSIVKISLVQYFLGMLYATGPTIEGVALWFLPHLFLSSIVAMICIRITARFPDWNSWICLILSLFIMIGISFIRLFWQIDTHSLGYLDQMFSTTHQLPGLPLSLDLVLLSSGFILLGFVFRKKVESMTFNFPIFSIALLLFSMCHIMFDETIDLNMRIYSHPFISSLQAILGIYIILAASAGLQNYKIIQRPLVYVGSGSLFILIFHTFIQEKVFLMLFQLSHRAYLSAVVSFGMAILGPLGILKLVQNQSLLAALLLPYKSRLQPVKSSPKLD